MIQPDFEKALDERDIKTFAVIGDDDFVSLDVLNEIIKILSLNISFNLIPIIKRDGGYIVEISIQSCGFDIQIDRGIPEFGKESPGLV